MLAATNYSNNMKQILIFTDLDGTLLDASTYSFEAAQEALVLIRERRVPLILCSSKTRAEIEHYRLLLGNNEPFISENGGAIFIPKGYLQLADRVHRTASEDIENYLVIRLGAIYKELRQGILALQKKGFDVRGFGDMTIDEVSQVTGLPPKEAAMAKERDFDEPFLFAGTEEELDSLLEAIRELGFKITQGKYFHLLGNSDKGKAASILIELFRRQFANVYSVALGDSMNDLPMLQGVDMPMVVRKENGTYDPSFITSPNLIRIDGIGPEGWNIAVLELLQREYGETDLSNTLSVGR
jgi:mannosyl-3-phosphoglycerate phosphatase